MLGARSHQHSDSSALVGVGGAAAARQLRCPAAPPAIKLSGQITDQSGVLGPLEYDAVNRALTNLYNGRGTRLWVVYVNNFGGLKPFRWAEDTMRRQQFHR